MINGKYSYKVFDRKILVNEDPKDFNDSEIVGASFFQDIPYTDVFPSGIKNVIFTRCNLDNCNIPEGCMVNGGTNRHFAVQEDQEYWIVGRDLKPIEPLDKSGFIRCGLSMDPKDIKKSDRPITVINDPKMVEYEKIQAFISDPEKVRAAVLSKNSLNNKK